MECRGGKEARGVLLDALAGAEVTTLFVATSSDCTLRATEARRRTGWAALSRLLVGRVCTHTNRRARGAVTTVKAAADALAVQADITSTAIVVGLAFGRNATTSADALYFGGTGRHSAAIAVAAAAGRT